MSNLTEHLNLSMVEKQVRVIPNIVERKINGKDYVYWGTKNDFPNYLWQLYLKSSVLQSIVNGTTEFVAGNEIKFNSKIENFSKCVNKLGETLEDIIKRITTDYFIFGGFALQIIYNGKQEISEIYWTDFQNIRTNEDESEFYYCENWKRANPDTIQKYRSFNPKFKYGTCIFYYKGNTTRGVYPVPIYSGAITAVETSTEISKFHLSNLLNNLESSAIISFNGGIPSQAEQQRIEERLRDKFSGADNAGKFIVTFSDSKENAATVARLSSDNFDKKFDALKTSTMQEIFIGFRCIPGLFGFNVNDQLFTRQEFEESLAVYKRNMIYPVQRNLVRIFNKIFDIENSLEFVKYTLMEEIEESKNKIKKEESNNE